MLIRKTRGRYTTYDEEEYEDTKGVIRISKSKKNRQHNGQRKMTNGQTTIYKTLHIKTKDRVTRTSLKTGGELRCSGRVGSSCSINMRHYRMYLLIKVYQLQTFLFVKDRY
jgi:hypothetical protein